MVHASKTRLKAGLTLGEPLLRAGPRDAGARWLLEFGRLPALGVALWLMAGCAYQGAIDQPVTLKATWFSYLNGDDIRAACAPGAPTWYRLVYNGNYEEQLRAYEVVGDGSGGAHAKARVQTGAGLNLGLLSLGDPQAAARWTTSQDRLSPADLAALESALEASGAFSAAPRGLRLASEQFYWVASLCRNGRFRFNAWLYPSARFAGLRFPETLLRHDGTGISVNPPREVPRIERIRQTVKGEGPPAHFDLEVGENRLEGHRTLF